ETAALFEIRLHHHGRFGPDVVVVLAIDDKRAQLRGGGERRGEEERKQGEQNYGAHGGMGWIRGDAVRLSDQSSPSRWLRKIRMRPMQANMRKAASWPFQVRDCHMRNHSPPTVMKATNHC